MKKLILSLGLLASVSVAAQAQSIKYGVKAGASLTNVTGDGAGNAKNIFGFHGGLVANFAVNDAFSIQPEVLYSMKGAKLEENLSGGGITYNEKVTSRLHYIDVPVMARINADGLFFELGPQVGFLIAAKQKSEISGSLGNGSSEDDIKNSLKTVDFGYAAGLGYQLSNGPGIGVRYNGGFTNINKGSNSPSQRNSAFQLYLSFMFGGK
jgi:hypothetical protein